MCKTKITVIIPVYNAESTLREAVESALAQTISDEMEVICVDDGSTDNTVELVGKMMSEYPQVRLLKQEHQGAGPARNKGIKVGEGKYISFLDADDFFCDSDALRRMVEACEKKGACICGSYRMCVEDGIEHESMLLKEFNLPNEGRFINYVDFQGEYDYQSFIYDKAFLLENHIEFPAYMRYQDPPFFVKAMDAAEKFYALPVVLYTYKLQNRRVLLGKYIGDILLGIEEVMKIALTKRYFKLVDSVADKVCGEFREAILENLSQEILLLLLGINKLKRKCDGEDLRIVKEICGFHKLERSRYLLERSNYLFNGIIEMEQREDGFKPFFEKHGIKAVAVYGLGKFGSILLPMLTKNGIEVVCGVDKKVREYQGITVLKPDDEFPLCDALIVSMADSEDVVEEYRNKLECDVFSFADIIAEMRIRE